MMRVTIPVGAGNKSVKDGSIASILETTMADIKPEAAFFTSEGGDRTAYLFFDLKETSDIPRIAERLFQRLDARVELSPVMNLEDLKRGLQRVEKTG
jgi:hypothetical protein